MKWRNKGKELNQYGVNVCSVYDGHSGIVVFGAGFIGFLVSASGMNDTSGDMRVNTILCIASLVVALIGLFKMRKEVKE